MICCDENIVSNYGSITYTDLTGLKQTVNSNTVETIINCPPIELEYCTCYCMYNSCDKICIFNKYCINNDTDYDILNAELYITLPKGYYYLYDTFNMNVYGCFYPYTLSAFIPCIKANSSFCFCFSTFTTNNIYSGDIMSSANLYYQYKNACEECVFDKLHMDIVGC